MPMARRMTALPSSADGERSMRHLKMAALGTIVLGATAMVIGCAATSSAGPDGNVAAEAVAVLKSSFTERGQAKLDRLNQDETQRLCTQVGTKAPPSDVA